MPRCPELPLQVQIKRDAEKHSNSGYTAAAKLCIWSDSQLDIQMGASSAHQ